MVTSCEFFIYKMDKFRLTTDSDKYDINMLNESFTGMFNMRLTSKVIARVQIQNKSEKFHLQPIL